MSTSTPVRPSHLPSVSSRIDRASNYIARMQGFFELRQYDIKPEGIKVRREAAPHPPLTVEIYIPGSRLLHTRTGETYAIRALNSLFDEGGEGIGIFRCETRA
jgi:hypothetical protein